MMSRMLIFVGALVLCLARLSGIVVAQTAEEPVQAEWKLGDAPEGGWTVGDHIPLRLSATYANGLQVALPELPQTWGPFEVLEQTTLEPVANGDGTLTLVSEVTVTLWAPGDYQTPPLAVRYQDTDGPYGYEMPLLPLTITVVSVLGEGEAQKRDLKPQVALPRPPLWPWLLGGLLLAVLLGVAGWFALARLRRRAAHAAVAALPLDTRTPQEIARSELERIAALDLPARGEIKRHYTLVADCMRDYVHGRYRIPAMDYTTTELMAAMRRKRINPEHTAMLRDLLDQADLVKFAKARPPIDQARTVIVQARQVVDVTTPGESASRRVSESVNQ